MRISRPTLSPRAARWLRLLSRHRRAVAAMAAAVAVGASLLALSPPPPPAVPIVVASRDLAGGHPLEADDLALLDWPGREAPRGTFRSATALSGRTLAAPVRRGEPVTDVRVAGSRLAAALPAGHVAVPVPLDGAAAALLSPGDRVDVLAAAGGDFRSAAAAGVPARVVAHDVVVLAVLADPSGRSGAADGGSVVLDTTPVAAADLASAAATSRLSVVLRPNG